MKKNKPMSLYILFSYCLAIKGKDIEEAAKSIDSTKNSFIKGLYMIDRGHETKLTKKIKEVIKKLCPKEGLLRRIKARS